LFYGQIEWWIERGAIFPTSCDVTKLSFIQLLFGRQMNKSFESYIDLTFLWTIKRHLNNVYGLNSGTYNYPYPYDEKHFKIAFGLKWEK
jgi:hypothetical protein